MDSERMPANVTMLELVHALTQQTASEAETIAWAVHLVNEGHVRLCGNFRGARLEPTHAC